MKICKYLLDHTGETRLKLPINSKILKVTNQYDKELVVWVQLPSFAVAEEFHYNHLFLVALTGHIYSDKIFDDAVYLETVQFDHGKFVAHIFHKFLGQEAKD